MDKVDAIVVGAGVIGLAAARALALRGHETLVLEQADAIGTGISSRNSEVVHAGLYYPPGSLKARLCVEGRERLHRYVEDRGIAHRRCGKLVVAATGAERGALAAIGARAAANGVHDLRPVERAELRRLEPALDAVAALHSPSTGIVDSHGLMLALRADLEAHGGAVGLRAPVLGATARAGRHVLGVGGAAPCEIEAAIVVNAAGLGAHRFASAVGGLSRAALPPRQHLAKGSYFSWPGRAPFDRLIYPVPEPGGLGVHLTLDLGGQARFGPDVEWLTSSDPDAIDWRVDPGRAAAFERSVRRYWPALNDGGLQPAYSGVRPKLAGPGEPDADFVLRGPAEHGMPGWLDLLGIESPGLTACLALADEAARRVGA